MNYDEFSSRLLHLAEDEAVAQCQARLPGLWIAEYRDHLADANVLEIQLGAFTFLFDLASVPNLTASDDTREDRVVAVFGRSEPPREGRDTSRMRGYLGPTSAVFGEAYDKGHFIAHSMGGTHSIPSTGFLKNDA